MKVLDCSRTFYVEVLKNLHFIRVLPSIEVNHAINLPMKVLEHSVHVLFEVLKNVHSIRVLQ